MGVIRIFDVECSEAYTGEYCVLLDEAFELIFDMEQCWTMNEAGMAYVEVPLRLKPCLSRSKKTPTSTGGE